ncbi:hypothetical protein SAMN05216276_106048 [Streptosporangium subroseum]|uniref:Uncharacterized protein n=1 Tax=Streptosporangium subroseum TaxID=106412 RepID=A0A239NJJ5_9ACTN|nr:hypothetical protein SAMN05216276_106048 [Streptosporangium subroseum]
MPVLTEVITLHRRTVITQRTRALSMRRQNPASLTGSNPELLLYRVQHPAASSLPSITRDASRMDQCGNNEWRTLNPHFPLLLLFGKTSLLGGHFGDVFTYGLHDKSDIKGISYQSDQ